MMMMQQSLPTGFRHSEAGGIAMMSAAFLMVAAGAAAFAIDIGALFVERRAAQGAVDLAALAAVQDLAHAEAAARATLTANGIDNIKSLTVETGAYTADANLAAKDRFVANGAPRNAARVSVERTGKTYFAKVFGPKAVKMQVAATATNGALAAFSIGSRLLAVREGVANKVLQALVGGNVALTAVDYNALLDTDIDLFKFSDALATELDLTAGTYDDVLKSSATTGDILSAAARVADANGDTTASLARRRLPGRRRRRPSWYRRRTFESRPARQSRSRRSGTRSRRQSQSVGPHCRRCDTRQR